MQARIFLIYGLIGPVAGALIYVAMSALAASIGFRPDIFIEPRFFGTTLARLVDLALWQVLVSAPLTLVPALLTGWLTLRRIHRTESCPWWFSCSCGALTSYGLAIVGLTLAHALGSQSVPIPPVAGGSALIALIGFVGTLPCWWLAVVLAAPAYRSSPQNR